MCLTNRNKVIRSFKNPSPILSNFAVMNLTMLLFEKTVEGFWSLGLEKAVECSELNGNRNVKDRDVSWGAVCLQQLA